MLIKRLSVVLAATVAAAAFSGSVLASTGFVTIYNTNHTVSIQQAWIANTGEYEDAWKPISMDGPITPAGVSNVTIRNTNACFFDIKVQFTDGTVQSAKNVNGCGGGSAAFY